jgi:two-component system sensor kinase FixL
MMTLSERLVIDDAARLLLDHVPAAAALFDLDMNYVACSRRWLSDYRQDGTDIVGRSHYEAFPELAERLRDTHRRVLAGESVSSEAEAFAWADGSVDWVKSEMVPWRDASGSVVGAALFSEFVTDLLETRAEAQTLARELDLLIDNATRHAICMLDPEGRIRIWNVGAERLFGWSDEEASGRSVDFLYTEPDRLAGIPRHRRELALRLGTCTAREQRLRKNGETFKAEVTITAIFDEHKAHIGFAQVVHDITEFEDRADQLALSAAHLQSILETVPDAMVVIDDQGSILSFSPAAEAMFGYAVGEVVGRNVSMLMPEPEASRHDGYLRNYHHTGQQRVIGKVRRVHGMRKDGSTFPHELFVGEAAAGDRKVFTGFLRDLTAREAAENATRELQAELVRNSRVSAVGTIATALAHDLNQPLAAVLNYVQTAAALLAEPTDDIIATVQEALNEAGHEAMRAGRIVQHLREFIGRGETTKSLARPAELIGDAFRLGTAGLSPEAITCEIDLPEEAPLLLADRVQMQQVFFNLVRNAAKAMGNEGGTIRISARIEGDHVQFAIDDTGPGLAPERLSRLFEPYNCGETGGMGLGLAICRTIVEAHGGRMWHEPGQAGGASFKFTVPIAGKDEEDG